MESHPELMNSWNLEGEVNKLPDNKLKKAIVAWVKQNKVANPYMNPYGLIYRSNLQYILEHIDKAGLIDEIEAQLPLNYEEVTMAALRTWIRRDRSNGQETEVKEGYARGHLEGSYKDVKMAMDHASKDNPLTNGFADYWPTKGNKLCDTCSHWEEEHKGGDCGAPGCDCVKFVEITDPNDARHIEEREADEQKRTDGQATN